MAPIIRYMRNGGMDVHARVCVTGQHREMLDQVLEVFQIEPDRDLDVMSSGQTLFQSTTRILSGLEDVLTIEKPDLVVVQGDTTSTFCGALAAFYRKIPVAHVEAGLRTGDIWQPFPEEANRLLTSKLTSLHFAATTGAANNLRFEGIDQASIFVTGNSGIDAVLHIASELERGTLKGRNWSTLDQSRKLVAVTAHRRENFGIPFDCICRAVMRLADRSDVEVVFPVHPNPHVSSTVYRFLSGHSHIHLLEPLDYISFVELMSHSYLLLTDSGGVQEEGPSLGKPVLVMRDKTERPEAVEAGTARLVGTNEDAIYKEASLLLENAQEYDSRSRIQNPYGDGFASKRIVDHILDFLTS